MAESKFSWYRLNRALHRDIGFFCVGLTIIYCVSGVAVNHIDQWNPTYKFEKTKVKLEKAHTGPEPDDTWIRETLQFLGLPKEYKSTFQSSPNHLRIFRENSVVDVDLKTLQATYEKVIERPILSQCNFLHLNKGKKWWTHFADIYAIALLYLAVSGLFMVKGNRGVLGWGGLFVLLGFLLPIIFIFAYH